jgi:uncharacterized membrane protein YqiK
MTGYGLDVTCASFEAMFIVALVLSLLLRAVWWWWRVRPLVEHDRRERRLRARRRLHDLERSAGFPESMEWPWRRR